MFDIIVVSVPVLIGGVVLGLSALILPIDIALHEVTVPSAIEDRGLSGEVFTERVHTELSRIVQNAGSVQDSLRFNVDKHRTGLEELAWAINLEDLVAAIHLVLGFRPYAVDVSISSEPDGGLAAYVIISDPASASAERVLSTIEVYSEQGDPNRLAHGVAEQVLKLIQPYTYAVHLYESALAGEIDMAVARAEVEQDLFTTFETDLHWPLYLNLRGLIAIQEEDYAYAIRCFRDAVAHDPNLAIAYTNWGHLWLGLRYPGHALTHFDAATRVADGYVPYNEALRARALVELGEPGAALLVLEEAEAEAPHYPLIHEIRADILDLEGDAVGAAHARLKNEAAAAEWSEPHPYKAY